MRSGRRSWRPLRNVQGEYHRPPMPGYDLHTHSTRSDGTLEPAAVVRLGAERGLEGIAITDHDTFAGLDEAAAAASEAGVAFVPGIEFSAEFEGASLHILGYWVDPENDPVRRELKRLTDTRFRRGELMIEKLQELGHDISFDRVREIAGGETIARPHVATAMVEAGIVATEKEAFDRFISDDGIAYVPKHALAPVDALDLIRAAGGACVLAHPGMWKGQGSVPDELIEQMAAGGMAGLEVDHPDHDPKQRAKYRAAADRLGLIPTGASDCHGERYGTRLGCDRTSPDLVQELRRRAGERTHVPPP
jgi:predicted metal-dependent phosphoesterase TrpH